MTRDLIASAATALLPLALLALTALAAWAARLVGRHIRDRRLALAVELAAYGAAAVVADLAQHVVSDLKNPTKAGRWDEVAATAVKLRAIAQVRALYPSAVRVLAEASADPSRVDELLGTLVERAVVDLKGRAVPAPVLVEASAPLAEGRPTMTPPPAPDEGTGHRPAGARGAL